MEWLGLLGRSSGRYQGDPQPVWKGCMKGHLATGRAAFGAEVNPSWRRAGEVQRRACDKAAPTLAVMLHLRSCYVS